MTPDDISKFFSFLYEGRIGQITFWLRPLAGVLASAFFGAIVVISIKFQELYKPTRATEKADDEVSENVPETGVPAAWQEVMKKFDSPNSSDWNLALIQADSIFDGLLKEMGLTGETMGDRLKALDPSKLNSLNDVWEAHKIRNRIAHGLDRALTFDEARRAVAGFAKGLRELQYLQD